MITIPYHLYSNSNAAAALGSVQAVADGPITAFQMFGAIAAGAAADIIAVLELAFTTPVLGFGTDSRSVIAKTLLQLEFGDATGVARSQPTVTLTGLMIPWALGERVYLNLGYIVGTGNTVYGGCIIHQAVDDKNYARMTGRLL